MRSKRVDLITDIQYCQAMARAGLLGSVVEAWDLIVDRCDMAAVYVDGLRAHLESKKTQSDEADAFSVVADLLKRSDRWRALVISRAVEQATAVLAENGREFEILPEGESVAFFYRDQIRPRLDAGRADPLLIASIWMQAHRYRDMPGDWQSLADTCYGLLCEEGDSAFYERGDTLAALRCFQLAAGLEPFRDQALWGTTTVCLQGSPMTPEEAIPYQALLARLVPKRDEMVYVLRLAVLADNGHGVSPVPGWSLGVGGLDRYLADPLEPEASDTRVVLEAKRDAMARVVEAAEERYRHHASYQNRQRILDAQWRAARLRERVAGRS
jgi:hypothetical protein